MSNDVVGIQCIDILGKYPITNSDWVYSNEFKYGRVNRGIGYAFGLYDAIGVVVNRYYDERYVDVGGISGLDVFEQTVYVKDMGECDRMYKGVTDYFYREVSIGDSLDMSRCGLDMWNRLFVVYRGNANFDGEKFVGDSVYNNGYVIKDTRKNVNICSINVTTVEGVAVYCLDIYK